MPKDDSTWLNIAYVLFALLVTYLGWNAIHTIGIQTGWEERYDEWYLPMSNIASIFLGVIGAVLLKSKPDRNEYFLSSISELRKVSWPSFNDTRKMTIIVCVVVGIFAVILAVFDIVWGKVLKMIIA